MREDFKGFLSRRHQNRDNDLEAGTGSGSFHSFTDEEDDTSGPFDIFTTESASADRLRRWRKAALVLNASRRFRCTLDLKKEEERRELITKIRAQASVIRAAFLFQPSQQGVEVLESPAKLPPTSTHVVDFEISREELYQMSRDDDLSALQQNGGVKGVADKLKTSLEKGIHGDETDLLQRKNAFGSNKYPRKKGRSIWRFLWEACLDRTLVILLFATAASLATNIKLEGLKKGWYDGGNIVLAIIIVIVVKAVSDYRQSLQLQNLAQEKQNIQVEVVRRGRRVKLSIFDLVVGDVVHLKIGDQVPADGILVSSYSLAINESSMTGESTIVPKGMNAPFLMSGCKVADGYGTMLVINVGINTEWGLQMASISEDNVEETPLQVRLNGVATYVGKVGLVVAGLVLIPLIIRFFIGYTYNPDGSIQFLPGKTNFSTTIDVVMKIFSFTVMIAIVVVPEGIPLAITLMLTYSMRKMMRDEVLPRRLAACESIGFATIICCDKTGTLTLNQMIVADAYICGKRVDPPANKSLVSPKVASLIIEGITQNTIGGVFTPEGGGDVEVFGSPTEKAILQWGLNLGMEFDTVRSNSSIIHAFPFNSERMRAGVVVKLANFACHIHWKGAAEIILASCKYYMGEKDQELLMDDGKLSHFVNAIDNMTTRGLRCIAIAYKSCQINDVPINEEDLGYWELCEQDLVLLAIVGIKDPCRPGVKNAVKLCKIAGVKVCMVTGDNLNTAKATALDCGILGSDADATEPSVIEGKTFRALSATQRLEIAEKISVMGRSSPNDKLLLVQALKERGHVVAVTGNGTNDAPALHEADIGLGMGIQGTEVVKESSDVIILDDNFVSVVKFVRWGRYYYGNIQKFIQFQSFKLTVNVAALVINIAAAVSAGDVPLNDVQLLWVNLIMDTLGAIALAEEPPTDLLMQRPPIGQREPLITNIMWRNLLIQAFYQVTVLLVLTFRGKSLLNLKKENLDFANKVINTMLFNVFVLCQIFNQFNARKPDEINIFKGVTKSRLFMAIVGITVVFQVIIIFFLGKFTSTVRLSWELWLVSIAIGFFSWPLAAIGKLIPVPETPFGELLKKLLRRMRSRA